MMVPHVRFRRRAHFDLFEITRYTLREWGAEQSSVYVDRIEDCCSALAENPCDWASMR